MFIMISNIYGFSYFESNKKEIGRLTYIFLYISYKSILPVFNFIDSFFILLTTLR